MAKRPTQYPVNIGIYQIQPVDPVAFANITLLPSEFKDQIGDCLRRGSEGAHGIAYKYVGSVQVDVPLEQVYQDGYPAILEAAYKQTQNTAEEPWNSNTPCRSTQVGDIFILPDGTYWVRDQIEPFFELTEIS